MIVFMNKETFGARMNSFFQNTKTSFVLF